MIPQNGLRVACRSRKNPVAVLAAGSLSVAVRPRARRGGTVDWRQSTNLGESRAMSFQYYMSFKGSKQGSFHGGSTKSHHNGWTEVVAVDYGCAVPYDTSSGKTSGRRQHGPIIIKRELDTATPALFQLCAANEVLSSIIIDIVEAEGNGWERTTHSITLTNARIAAIVPRIGPRGQSTHELSIEFEGATVTPAITFAHMTLGAELAGLRYLT
jgi:type VI secretion system secreted protein Hcp